MNNRRKCFSVKRMLQCILARLAEGHESLYHGLISVSRRPGVNIFLKMTSSQEP